MPGLLRGMARVAVVSGTATAVSNRVSRRQTNRWGQNDQAEYAEPQYAQPQSAPPPPAPADDMFDQLEKLGELKEKGILTDEEFAAEKAKVLAG